MNADPVEHRDLGQLVDRRAALLEGARGGAELVAVSDELRFRLETASPVVRRLTLDDADDLPARLAAREPVHPLEGPDHLEDRLHPDRRLFALEHPLLPGRPMNVVWVALWQGVPDRIDALLDPTAPTLDPQAADTAVYYSIWNAEPGLEGLGRGRTLIEGATEHLRADLPHLSTFVTLSPVPGFRAWLGDQHPQDPHEDELPHRCARYLTSLDGRGRPLDPVARFHLGNGARLWRVNPGGDRSERGMERSFGVMANYRYEPEDRAANRAALAAGSVPVSESVRALLH